MSTVSLAEVLMFLHRHSGADPTRGLNALEEFEVEFVSPDLPTTLLAAESRNWFSISFGDRFCYALAKVRNEPILTLDADFGRTDVMLVSLG